MPATACLRSRPLRKMSDGIGLGSSLGVRGSRFSFYRFWVQGSLVDLRTIEPEPENPRTRTPNPEPRIPNAILSLIANLPNVRRERVERLQLARVRALERELEIRQEGVVVRNLGRALASRGDRRDARVQVTSRERRGGHVAHVPLVRGAESDTDEQSGGRRGRHPARRRPRLRGTHRTPHELAGEADDPRRTSDFL